MNISGDILRQIVAGQVSLGGFGVSIAWSLLNLIMGITSLFSAIILFVTIFKRKWTSKEEAEVDQNGAENPDNEAKLVRSRLMALRLPDVSAGRSITAHRAAENEC